MKGAQQLFARRPGSSPVNVQASEQARTKVLTANHVALARRGRLEAEAVDLAERVLRGQKKVRPGSGTAATSVRIENSLGHRLPLAMLREAEEGFDADLSLVRIHSDAHAARVASNSGARAFTAGTDIFFAEGRYDPSSETGRRLILHEVAHVLQQTAQAASGTRLRATNATGSGAAQADDSDPKPLTISDLRSSHTPDSAKVTGQYDTIAGQIAQALADPDPAQAIDTFASNSMGSVASWPEAAESLLYDALKLQGKYDRAAELLARDDFAGALRIRTAFDSTGDILGAIEKRPNGFDALRTLAEKHDDLKPYFDEYIRLIEVFILQPVDQPIPQLFRKETVERIKQHYDRLVKALADRTALTPNEMVINALSTLVWLDALRIFNCEHVRTDGIDFVTRGEKPEIYRKRYHAEAFQLYGKELPKQAIGSEDASGKFQVNAKKTAAWKPYFTKLGGRIESAAKKIIDLWDRAKALKLADAKTPKQGDSSDHPKIEPPKELEFVKSVSEAVKLPDQLKKLLEELNKPDSAGKRPPDGQEFEWRILDLADSLEKFSRTSLEKRQPALFHQNKLEEEVAIIWLTIWLYRVAAVLRWGAGTGTDKGGTVRVYDSNYLIAIRLSVAWMLAEIAAAFDWQSVAEAAAIIAEGRLEKLSQLALLKDPDGKVFKEDQVDVEEMTNDMASGAALKELAPLTSLAIALFYRREYYRELKERLVARLPKTTDEEKKFVDAATLKDAFIAGQVAKEVNQLPHPHRFSSASTVFYVPKEGDADFRIVFSRWLDPTKFLADNTKKGEIPLVPTEFTRPLWIWFVPGFTNMVPILKRIGILRTQVKTALAPDADQDKLSDKDWLDTLMRVLGPQFFPPKGKAGATDDEKKAILEAIRTELLSERDKAWNELVPNLQKGTRIDREILAPAISKWLEKYKGDHITNFTLPGKALGAFVAYDTSIVPDTEEPLQTTSLILEIAPALASAFEYETRFDIIDGWFTWLELALENAPRLKALADDARGVYLPPQENTAKWVQEQADKVQGLLDHFESVRAETQREAGFNADASANTIADIHFGYPVAPGTEVYAYSGTTYTLVQVLKSFRYHPSYGTKGSTDKTKGKKKTGAYAEALILDPSGEKPLDLKPGEKLLKVKIGKKGAERDVGPGDTAILDDLSFGANQYGFVKSMENLAAAIDTYMDILLDVVELVPGMGQIVTGARVTAAILQFLASGDYKSAIELLSGEIQKTLEGLLDKIKSYLDPENLLLLLLFGDERLEALLAHTSIGQPAGAGDEKKGEETQKAGSFAFLKRVIAAFRKLGHALAVAMRWLHDKVERRMDDFRSFVSTRPALAFAIGFAAKYIYELVAWTQKAFLLLSVDKNDPDRKPEDQATDITTKIKEQQAGIGERIHHIMTVLHDLKLPDKILDLAPVLAKMVDIILDLVLKRLGVKGTVINIIAKHTGLRGWVSGKVGQTIVDAGLDPNVYWRETVVPQISDEFNAARDAVVSEFNKILSSKPLTGLFPAVAKREPATLLTEGEPYEETTANLEEQPQPYPSPDRPLRIRPELLPRTEPGSPLHTALRARFESRFGMDLSHVRLHTGADARNMTDAFGADALTTGSHVFLRPDVSPDNARGHRILSHELVHVAQQTGVVPPGAGGRSPSMGRPELGLNFNLSDERMADRISEHVPVGGFPQVGTAEAGGFQPAGIDLSTLAAMLKAITDVKAVEQSALLMEKEAKKEKLPAAVATAVDNTLAFFKQFTKTKMAKPPSVFSDSDIQDSIVNQLTHPIFLPLLEKVLQTAAKESLEDLPQPQAQKGAKPAKPDENQRVLIPGHFARKLEGYVLARTGIAIALTMNEKEVVAPNGKKVKTVDESTPIKELRPYHVHLPVIDSNSRLWSKALDNTWKASVGDDKMRARLRSILRPLLTSKGVVFGIWAWGSTYRFSFLLELEVNGLMKAGKAGPLDPDALPPWKDYVKAEKPGDTIGLRIATYADASQTGTGRESHHLTQFLLADYFSNTNDVKPFNKAVTYPGVAMDLKTGVVTTITPSSGTAINVAATKGKGRGDDMPAISLAAATHRGGDLHITPEPDDIGGAIQKRQAYGINNEFIDRQMPALAQKPASFAQYVKQKGESAVKDEIWTAAQKTYAWVEKRMSKQMHKNMADLEFDYYTTLDEEKTTPALKNQPAEENLFKTALQAVPADAYARNKTAMQGFGWNLEI